MSHPSEPSNNISYDPLPLTNDEHIRDTLYNTPPSPEPAQSFHTPRQDPHDFLHDDSSIPLGAAQPRFVGAALYDDASNPRIRDSIASSHNAFPSVSTSEFNSSVYALNDTAGSRPLSAPLDGGYRDDPGAGYFANEQGGVPMSQVGQSGRYLEEKRDVYAAPAAKSKRKFIVLAILGALILLILAIVIPVYFAVVKPKSGKDNNNLANGPTGTSSSGHPQSTTSSSGNKPSVAIVTGGDGSKVTMDDGTTFTYSNKFGGTWYWDENDPFNNNAQAQSWTPPLNSTFNYGIDRIWGVNLGGWLNTEPFITPALFEPYVNSTTPAVDEWTLSEAMTADTANGGISQLENHYKTFITEQDFAEIAGAGLNYVRIPLPYWAIEVRSGEPFLPKTSWTYFLKAIQWARKYGIRINLDLHALPGSQNGWNHSGRLGTINFLNGPMGLANAQRALDYIRIIAEFVSQPQYSNVVSMFGIMNEPQGSTMGQDNLSRFYLQAYDVVREASGVGANKGPFISFHDGFFGQQNWAGFLPNADRISIDTHPYLCFQTQSAAPISSYANTPCTAWGGGLNASMGAFGLSTAGEFSNAVTDCGLWVNGVGLGTRYDGTYTVGNWPKVGTCDSWTDWQSYDQPTKDAIKVFAMASMDALQNWFFWTWKIGNSSVTGKVESPAWSYKLGLDNGWMPTDPRQAVGACQNADPWTPPLAPWQTGGAGAGNIAAAVSSSLVWPPTIVSNAGAASLLPTYTPTGAVPTLPAPTFTGSSVTATASVGDGWANSGDTAGLMVNIASCSYLDPWIGPTAAPPSPLCSGAAKRRLDFDLEERSPAPPAITPPPQNP